MNLSQLSIADLRAIIVTLREKEELYVPPLTSKEKSIIREISLKRQEIEDHLDQRISKLVEWESVTLR